jgi:hypothetical protein
MTEKSGKLTINQLAPLRPLPKALLQIIRRALPLKLERLGLQRRRGVGVEQDVAVLEVLLFRAGLQVFLQTVAAIGWRDGRDVDAGVVGLGGGGEGGWLGGHVGCAVWSGGEGIRWSCGLVVWVLVYGGYWLLARES